MIRIEASLESVPFARAMTNGRQRFNPPRYREFKEELGWQARMVMGERAPLTNPLSIKLKVYRRLPPDSLNFGDIDNHLKATLDSLNGIVFIDDRQVICAEVELLRGEPRIEIEMEERECG